MQLTSIEFLMSLTLVFALWRLVPTSGKNPVLLVAGYLFCAWWQPWFVLVLAYCTGVSGWAGKRMSNMADPTRCRRVMLGAVAMNLLPLLFFKYTNFFMASVQEIPVLETSSWTGWRLDLLLPVGISFYTFQAVSWCADVYRKKATPAVGWVDFALYLSFFPRLLSGPIERAGVLLPQLTSTDRFSREFFVSGVRLFMWGMFKKMVIADRLGMYVDMVFGDPETMVGKTAILGAWMFSLQIYCDFSAYMDMAMGCGRMFGIRLSRNFHFPYMARSIADFWRRWHITLTSWFRDYVYIPLGGNRVGTGQWAVNILAVFLLSGLWHGAAWTFVFWGGLHGMFYLAGRATERVRIRIRRAVGLRGRLESVLQVVITFQLVSLAWVFFRADSFGDAICLITNMGIGLDQPVGMLSSQFSTVLAFAAAIGFAGIELMGFWAARKQFDPVQAIPPVIRYPAYAAVMLAISLLGVSRNEFIYFQF